MKFAFRGLLCLIALAAACAHAQTIQQGTFKHIIFVIQENRTPDNLFGSGPSSSQCGTEDPFEIGVDIENGGYGYVPHPTGHPVLQLICNSSLPLSAWDPNLPTPGSVDPNHSHDTPPPGQPVGGWVADFDGGN